MHIEASLEMIGAVSATDGSFLFRTNITGFTFNTANIDYRSFSIIEHGTDLLFILDNLRFKYVTVIDNTDAVILFKRFALASSAYGFNKPGQFWFSTTQSFNGDLYCSSYDVVG